MNNEACATDRTPCTRARGAAPAREARCHLYLPVGSLGRSRPRRSCLAGGASALQQCSCMPARRRRRRARMHARTTIQYGRTRSALMISGIITPRPTAGAAINSNMITQRSFHSLTASSPGHARHAHGGSCDRRCVAVVLVWDQQHEARGCCWALWGLC